jgi:anti-sigma factor RsiW
MSEFGPKLSAWLDSALPPDEAQALEALLKHDPALQAELTELMAANEAANAEFATMLAAPVPLSLARSIDQAPLPVIAQPRRLPAWAAIAASLALLAVGAGGGFLAGQRTEVVAARDWIEDVAEYHAVYAAQSRHLVEVPASDSQHIKTWLTAQVGAPFDIPDLAAEGLEFQGARLLVAAGKPVGQLMYRNGAGQVVALCFVASDKPATDDIQSRQANGFQMRVWGRPGARFVLIGPEGLTDISKIAEAARAV